MFQQQQAAPDFRGILPSASYTPFEPGHTVADGAADSEKVRADLKKLSTLTRAVRLYSSTEGNELVPPIAAEFGMKVTVGAWIDKDSIATIARSKPPSIWRGTTATSSASWSATRPSIAANRGGERRRT